MYKVMIIDDEKALRNLLKRAIPWGELGLEVVGEAASGIEAINTIDEIKPDITFVDIRMPFMDGIEFSKLAIERYPELKILILTAFDDFKYAKECIGIGVFEYLLKPIVRKDICEVLERVTKQLDKRQKEEKIEERGTTQHVKIAEVQEYLRRHYAEPGLNLTFTAKLFGFNASYFSRKFKEETGKSFVDFLTAVRIQQACILGRAGELMYITAEKVGIPDPNYFGKCFKKHQGISYSEYTKQAGKNIPY